MARQSAMHAVSNCGLYFTVRLPALKRSRAPVIGLAQRQTSKGTTKATSPEALDSRQGSSHSTPSQTTAQGKPPMPSHNQLGPASDWQTTAAVVSNPYPQPPQPTPLQSDQSTKSASKRASQVAEGSCPGNGECNGLGGRTCCNGCPALNNRLLYSNRAHKDGGGAPIASPSSTGQAETKPAGATDGEGSAEPGATSADGGMECVNCGTSESTGKGASRGEICWSIACD